MALRVLTLACHEARTECLVVHDAIIMVARIESMHHELRNVKARDVEDGLGATCVLFNVVVLYFFLIDGVCGGVSRFTQRISDNVVIDCIVVKTLVEQVDSAST